MMVVMAVMVAELHLQFTVSGKGGPCQHPRREVLLRLVQSVAHVADQAEVLAAGSLMSPVTT